MKERSYAAPVVVLLMALPLVYIGSYFAMVTPYAYCLVDSRSGVHYPQNYRCGNNIGRVFLPIERFDRTLRPKKWSAILRGKPVEIESFLRKPLRRHAACAQ